MSFGFSVGDFIAAIELVNKIRKGYLDAPGQFKAISDEYAPIFARSILADHNDKISLRSLSIVLLDADATFPKQELDDYQVKGLGEIDESCRRILNDLQRILDNHTELELDNWKAGKRIKRVWKRLNWKPDDIDELRKRIDTSVGLLNNWNGRFTRDNVVKLVQHQENQERKAILDWLTLIDYTAEQNDLIKRWQAGSGQWLLDSDEFQAWVKGDQQVLFCPGIPGVGKTIVASIVVDYLSSESRKNMDVGIAYIYFNFRRQDQLKPEGLLASLLKQLAGRRPTLSRSVKDFYNSHKENRTQPTIVQFSDALQSVSMEYSRVFVVLDALDECQAFDGCRTRFLTEILAFQAKSNANLFATSRFIPEINEYFSESMQLEIRASDQDVQRYLENYMTQLPRCVHRSPELQDEIKTEIMKAIDGMFLLAQLHFNSLKGKTSPKAIRTALKKLPTGSAAYSHSYDIAMERINGQLADEAELAMKALSWITCAKRPLTTIELQHALGVELEESQFDEDNLSPIEDIVSVCAGLVTVDEESGIIRLVHYTTQDYLKRTQDHWFPNAEIEIGTICATYVSFETFQSGSCENDHDFEERLRLSPLYDYASNYWGFHARVISNPISIINNFLDSAARVEASSQVLFVDQRFKGYNRYSQDFPKQITGLHLAAYFGIESALRLLLEKGADVNTTSSNGETPLLWASEGGHVEVVRLLLEKGADLNMAFRYRWPLSRASEAGHFEVVRLLLEKGADMNTASSNGETPLLQALKAGHVKVVQLLLEKGADVNKADSDGFTLLSWASRHGYLDVVQLLLEKGADVNKADSNGETPLSHAVETEDINMIRLLLEKGADVTKADIDGCTPLFWAIDDENINIIQLLLEEGAELNAANSYGWTPLSFALKQGHINIARLFLEKGATMTAAEKEKWTILSQASKE